MKLEFLPEINEYNDSLIRLYDFDSNQATKLQKEISQTIISDNSELDLSKIDFIERINCNLTFRISDLDLGISFSDDLNFYCDLTIERYNEMILIIEPFTREIKEGTFNWLYDLNIPIELLLSPYGNW